MQNEVETFRPENLTLNQIFNCDRIYRIPNYQRQYSWVDKQLEELWEDLYYAFIQKNQNNDCCFLGTIVVVNKENNYDDLIDGQQRITTLMILLNVLLKSFPDINENVELTVDKIIITKKIIENRIKNENGFERLQLQSYKDYNSLFKNCIINCDDFSKIEKPNNKQLQSNEPEYKYKNTANFFYNKLKKLSIEERGEFINYIFCNVNIIKIICANESFAIKLFQIMNDRGLNLTSSDIIKAYMIAKYDIKEIDAISAFEADWSSIESIANDYEFTLDEFMVYFEYYKLKSNPKKQLTDEMKVIIDEQEVKDIISEMKYFAESIKILFNSEDKIIYSLRYLPWSSYIITMMASAINVNYECKDELFKLLRRFFYICLISGKNLNQIKQTSFNIIASIINKDDIKTISDMLEKWVKENRMIELVYTALNGEYVYGERWLKPLMLSIDYNVRDEMNKTFVEINNKLHIDHILPQAFLKDKDWNYIKPEEGNKYLNTLGNMALLSDVRNKEALNKGFDKKIKKYIGNSEEGTKNTGFTIFETTMNIVRNYNETNAKWNIEQIEDRRKYLIEEIEAILDIKPSN